MKGLRERLDQLTTAIAYSRAIGEPIDPFCTCHECDHEFRIDARVVEVAGSLYVFRCPECRTIYDAATHRERHPNAHVPESDDPGVVEHRRVGSLEYE